MHINAFRYDTTCHWYKGNTHIHTVASDGGKSADEVAELYAAAGYDFLFFTDHWVASDVDHTRDGSAPLLLDGVELDGHDETGAYFHVVCLGTTDGIASENSFDRALAAAREQGAVLVLAHPHWSSNTLEDATRWGFHGVEIYNHVCHWLNGKSDGAVHWNAMLQQNPNTLGLSVDDAHLHPGSPGWNGGWIVVNAPELSRNAILTAIKNGNFYASCGPAFESITFDGETVVLTTSPVRFVRLVGPASLGKRLGSFDGGLLTYASLAVPLDWDYVYLEIEDEKGRRAWSNPLFVADHNDER